jgi:hypothetical protein
MSAFKTLPTPLNTSTISDISHARLIAWLRSGSKRRQAALISNWSTTDAPQDGEELF